MCFALRSKFKSKNAVFWEVLLNSRFHFFTCKSCHLKYHTLCTYICTVVNTSNMKPQYRCYIRKNLFIPRLASRILYDMTYLVVVRVNHYCFWGNKMIKKMFGLLVLWMMHKRFIIKKWLFGDAVRHLCILCNCL